MARVHSISSARARSCGGAPVGGTACTRLTPTSRLSAEPVRIPWASPAFPAATTGRLGLRVPRNASGHIAYDRSALATRSATSATARAPLASIGGRRELSRLAVCTTITGNAAHVNDPTCSVEVAKHLEEDNAPVGVFTAANS